MLQDNAMITLTNPQKVLDQTTVIDIPTLEVEAGEVTALVEPVDSGKEILFQLVCGRTQPTTGSVRLAGLGLDRAQQEFSR